MSKRVERDSLEPDLSRELTPAERFARAIARRDKMPVAAGASAARTETAERRAEQMTESDQPRFRCPVCSALMVCVGDMGAALMYRCDKCRAGLSVPRPGHP